jgi:aldehyde:ferredoxin oxidoreductase
MLPRERLQEMIQAYYASRGWDREGNVRRDQVEALHLADLSRTPA